LALGACRGERAVDGLEAAAIAGFSLDEASPKEAPITGAAVPGAADPTRPTIAFQPDHLRVYRATPVDFAAVAPQGLPQADWEKARCEWTFGDGSPLREGCDITHTFNRGTSDERVTLSVAVGGETFSATQIIPLERLSVSGGGASLAGVPGAIPSAPAKGDGNLRVAFLSATADEGTDWAGLMATIKTLGPSLVVHLGGVVGPDAEGFHAWEAVREALAEPLRREGVPLVWALAPSDLAGDPLVRRPSAGLEADDFELAPDSVFPNRYAFAYQGVYFAVLTGAEQSKEDLAWLRANLTEAQIYESRIVISHLPLHPFSAASTAVLGPKFKLYELLLRTRVSALVSAGQGVFFDGRYGALPVLSVGRISGAPAALAGHDFVQPPTLVVVDVVRGQLERTFALEHTPEGSWGLFDAQYLPETVEVYTR